MDPILVPEGEGGVFRLVIAVSCPGLFLTPPLTRGKQPSRNNTPAVTNTRVDNKLAYDTNDLLQRHPINSRLYRIYGRADDQIMHSTGEKVRICPWKSSLLAYTRIDQSGAYR